jgi:hypothetical protein
MTWSLFGAQTLHLVGPTAELHPVSQNAAVFGITALGTGQIFGSRNSTWIARLDWLKKIVLSCLTLIKKIIQAWYHMGYRAA